MRMRRLLAVLLLLSMLVSVVPTSVFAVETENGSDGETAATAVDPSTAPSDNLFVDKTVTLTEDGTYSINMEAYATGTPITKTVELGVPLDVVLVVDQSASMTNGVYGGNLVALRAATQSFVDALYKNGESFGVNHRISVCGFASDSEEGPSRIEAGLKNYTYAGNVRDFAWVNTGLFVDGEFVNYGKVEYTPVKSAKDIDRTKAYAIDFDGDGNGLNERIALFYYSNEWRLYAGTWHKVGVPQKDSAGNIIKTAEEVLFENYNVYHVGQVKDQLTDAHYFASWESVAAGENGTGGVNPIVDKIIDGFAGNGSTRTLYGLMMAKNMLENAPKDGVQRKRVVIVFTDGAPGYSGYNQGDGEAALAAANRIKEMNVEIYGVALAETPEAEYTDFMNKMSSNYQKADFVVSEENFDFASKSSNAFYKYQRKLSLDIFAQSKYFHKDANGEYWPIAAVCEDYDDNNDSIYRIVYVTDEGEKLLVRGKKSEINSLIYTEGSPVGPLYVLGELELDPKAKTDYFLHADSSEKLFETFSTIAKEMTTYTSEVMLDSTAILKDVMADGFTLTDNTTITVSVVPGSVSEDSGLTPEELTADKITWGKPQQVVSMNARAQTATSESFVVTGAFDQTEMTLTATAEDGIITVTGYNYAAQFIGATHPGSKLAVTVTGVEADKDITTNAATATNKGTSGVYEGMESDADGDGIPGEIETAFPVPTTYLTSEYYYLEENNTVTFAIKDFLMAEGIHVSNGFHFFDTAAPGTTLETEYGKVTVNDNGTVTYTLNEGVELEKDVIYLFGKTEEPTVTGADANKDGYMWSKITIYPPKNVQGDLHLDKSASLEANGTYTIDLEAFATGTPVSTIVQEGIPLDVVLVIDQSGSLAKNHIHDDLKNAVSAFVEELKVHGEAYGIRHRVSMAGFAGGGLDEGTGVVGGGYPMANDPEDGVFYPHWINTGLFVNGEFKNYGTVEYDKIESASEIDVGKRLIFEFDYENDGIVDRWYTQAQNCLSATTLFLDENGKETKKNIIQVEGNDDSERLENLFEKYPLYRVGGVKLTLTDDDYTAAWEYVADGQNGSGNINQDITRAISRFGSNGATKISYGLKMASKLIEKAPDDHIERKTIVVVFTDGVPAYSEYEEGEAQAALAEAKKIKEKSGVEIYSIGVYANQSTANQAQDFMSKMSSNYSSHQFSTTTSIADTGSTRIFFNIAGELVTTLPYFHKDANGNYWPVELFASQTTGFLKFYYKIDEHEVVLQDSSKGTYDGLYTLEHTRSTDPNADYYRYTLNVAELEGMFKNIVTDATTVTSEVTLDASSILKDVMADGFKLTGNTTITVSVLPGSVKEEYANLDPDELTETHISWGTSQQVLSFQYSTAEGAENTGSGDVIVNGAADQTEMTITATATKDGVITVSGFNYANPTDNHKENAQYICAGHPGSKLMVTITGVEAKYNVVTDSITGTNKGASGIYEAPGADADNDGVTDELIASFPLPSTYLTSKTYYVDYSGKLIIDPADFLMTIKGYSLDKYGYHGFGAYGTTIELDHGTVTVRNDGKLEFTMKSDGLDITDTFYLFGKTDDSTVTNATANANGNMWSKVTIITPEDITGKLFLDKEATLTDDGTYTIDLNAYATGTPASTIIKDGIPLDVVLVVDQSGSMAKGSAGATMKEMQVVVENFVKALYENGESFGTNHRISICGFAAEGMELISHCVDGGYSYADEQYDQAWMNTGIFVNGGFKKYGKAEYTPVTSAEEISGHGFYLLKCEFEERDIYGNKTGRIVTQFPSVYIDEGFWRIHIDSAVEGPFLVDKNGEPFDSNEVLFENYGDRLYKMESHALQLTPADYAASWENVAAGANGTGGVNPTIQTHISKFGAAGCTRIQYGLNMARQMLENIPDANDGIQRKKIVVVFADGLPSFSSYYLECIADPAMVEAGLIKDMGVEIFGISLANENTQPKQSEFITRLSSNCPAPEFKEATFDITKAQAMTNANFMLNYAISGISYAKAPLFYKVGDEFYQIVAYWPKKTEELSPRKYLKEASDISVHYITDAGDVLICEGDSVGEINQEMADEPIYEIIEPVVNDQTETKYLLTASNADALNKAFGTVVEVMTTYTSEVMLDSTAILKDVMADGFTLTDNTTITVSVVPGSVSTANSNIPANELTSDKITWGEPQQVLSFAYPTETEKSGSVVVNGAADRTEKMTLTAKVTEDGIITVDGFNYAGPTDPFCIDAQYIRAGHPGSKLVVTITGVEVKTDVVTDSVTTTNKGTSGIYESENSDLDEDGEKGELQASFPIPTTYLTSEFYYLDENNSVTFNPKDFLMTVKGINADPDGYNFFDVNNPGTTVETQYGTVTVNEDGTVTYQLTNTDWENEDIFYLFGKTEDPTVTDADANKDGNMWSKITILPPKDAGGKLHVDKEATLESNGTYTIDLSAFATGTPSTTVITEGVPLDVVLVVDQSASMAKGSAGADMLQTKEIVADFVKALYANGESFGINHRISICGFGTEGMEGTPHCVDKGYSYADEQYDQAWINTGIFVNGGFKKYGKAEYTPVTSAEEISGHGFYLLKCEFEERDRYGNKTGRIVTQFPQIQIDGGFWRLCIDSAVDGQYPFLVDKNGKPFVSNEVLFENYGDRLYKMESHALQLTPADYAASWENVAAGANGTGGVNPTIQTHISKFGAAGCTRIQYGLNMARQMLENIPDANDGIQRKKIVVVFADGLPSFSSYYLECIADPAMVEAGLIKDMGVEIFGISLANENTQPKQSEFITRLSSNCPAPEFKEATFDITKAQAMTNANFMLNYAISGISYAKAPLFYKVGDEFYQIVAYWPKKTEELSPRKYLKEASDISVHYITDAGDVLICEGDSVGEINQEMADEPIYEIIEPVVNDQTETKYLLTASNADALNKAFGTVVEVMTTYTSEVMLDSTAILKDVMADGFTLTDNTTITVSVVPGSVKEEYAELSPHWLTEDHIDWSAPQQVLTFAYPAKTSGTGNVIVNGAADQTQMTLKAEVKDGVITVTGFNYASPADNHKENAQYICAGHPGSKLVVTITGVEAKSNVVTDHVTVTNKGTSGIYEASDSDMDGDGVKGEIQSSFPVPTTYMASKVYVVDYAKTMTINPADFKMTNDAVSVDVDGYNRFDPAVTAVTGTYGKVTVDGGKITYTPTKTNWNGYDTFYIFGTTNNATIKAATANENGNMWAKVSVVPANNVYYEDTFVTNEDTGVVGIVFGGVWEEVDEAGNTNAGGNGQGENAESGESTTKDDQGNDHQGGVHGWEDNLADDTGFSDGSAHIAGTDGKSGATAIFTFTGTGVDIYSRTNDKTGMVLAMLYEGTSTTDENGKNLVAKYTLMVDNLAASGDYYQVPTLSFFQIPKRDEDGKIIKDKETGETEMIDLPYGTYTVKIIVSKVGASQTGSERFLYYLDGIRVYNPVQKLEKEDSTVSGAYGEKELNANFVEIRDKLLDANSFSAEDAESAGPVFIDRITSEDGSHTDNTETVEIGTYKVFGPKNEVYLSANQIVAFAVPYTEGAHYYIGMKSLTGKTVKVIPNSTDDYVNLIVVGHTTDQYYEIIPEWEYDEHGNPTTGIIFVHADIANGDYKKDENGNYTYEGAILALTKLKVTGPKAKNFKFARVSNDKLLEMIAEDLAPSLDMDDTNSSPDVGGNTPNKPNVDINKPSSDEIVDEQTALKNLMIDLLTRIFSDLRGWFKS